ncbi:hypothetical protein ZWY2020_004749 [Hordeum vulgare]|nr:hypothetical protein ZWY2020_004749 [Hordeum vulgare]
MMSIRLPESKRAVCLDNGEVSCCDKASVKRGPWSREEDAVLRNFVQRFANAGNWITLPHKAGLNRCGKSCRLRWLNYLRPALRHGGFTEEEDDLILSLYGEIGSRWSVIAAKLPGRTDNDVKNHWNTKLKKRYLLTTAPSTPPIGDDNVPVRANDSPPGEDQSSLSPLPPALVNLDAASPRSTTAESSRNNRSSCTPSSWGSSSRGPLAIRLPGR